MSWKKKNPGGINGKSFDNRTGIHYVRQPGIHAKHNTTQTVRASFHSPTSARSHSSKGRIQRSVSLISYSDCVDKFGNTHVRTAHPLPQMPWAPVSPTLLFQTIKLGVVTKMSWFFKRFLMMSLYTLFECRATQQLNKYDWNAITVSGT